MAGHFLYWPGEVFVLKGTKLSERRLDCHIDPPAIFLVWQWNLLDMMGLLFHEFGHYIVWLFTRRRSFIEQSLAHIKYHRYFSWL